MTGLRCDNFAQFFLADVPRIPDCCHDDAPVRHPSHTHFDFQYSPALILDDAWSNRIVGPFARTGSARFPYANNRHGTCPGPRALDLVRTASRVQLSRMIPVLVYHCFPILTAHRWTFRQHILHNNGYHTNMGRTGAPCVS
jgi:hypothetical protein